MIKTLLNWDDATVLDAAIIAGLMAVFLAVAVPVTRGAILRQHTAECARKIMRAADAFDLYARSYGAYPRSQCDRCRTESEMRGAFAACDIDWWRAATEMGGEWGWYNNGKTSSVVIAGAGIPERQMAELDKLLDDGNLETGTFQRRGSRYHYIIRDQLL
jgi:hypothetical protein